MEGVERGVIAEGAAEACARGAAGRLSGADGAPWLLPRFSADADAERRWGVVCGDASFVFALKLAPRRSGAPWLSRDTEPLTGLVLEAWRAKWSHRGQTSINLSPRRFLNKLWCG